MSIQTVRVVLVGTFPNASTRNIDLGVVSVRDAVRNGRTVPLIPYAEGRLISSVRFVAPAIAPETNLAFCTPNTFIDPDDSNGYAFVGGGGLSHASDTLSLIGDQTNVGLNGHANSKSQILDCGPLWGLGQAQLWGWPVGTWTPNTPYCLNDCILDSNEHIQDVTVNGVSGATEPVWDTNGGDTIDGSITWSDSTGSGTNYDIGEVHAVVEVVEGVSPMPKYAASIEFVVPPVNVMHGATMANITVIVKDQDGNPFTWRSVFVQLWIYGTGTLVGTNTQETNPTTGIATFNDLSITEPGTGYILRAQQNPLLIADPIFSPPFNVT